MGADGSNDELLRNKIQKMEEETSVIAKKKIDTMDFRKMRGAAMTVGGDSSGDGEEEKYI